MIIIKVLVLTVLVLEGRCVMFTIKNNESGPIQVGVQGFNGKKPLANGGFDLETGAEKTFNASDDWAGRFWAKTWCKPNTNFCETGDCGSVVECNGSNGTPPATYVEITLRGWGGLDYYGISLVDGFNLKASITPEGSTGTGDYYSCAKAACDYYLNDECPKDLKLIGISAGYGIGCKSACVAFDTDEYCCRNKYEFPENCNSTKWSTNYPAFFKQHCPDAYSYVNDDSRTTFTCVADSYRIQFG